MAGLAGSAVLVTGAASGIGRACCQVLAARGWRVALADREEEAGRAAAAELRQAHAGCEARFYPLDVRDEEQTEGVVGSVVDDFGRLDGAVANAGVVFQRPFVDTTLEEFTVRRQSPLAAATPPGRWA